MIAVFLRLLRADNKATALEEATSVANAASAIQGEAGVFRADPQAFVQVPGSPFAYWASKRARDLYSQLTPVQSKSRKASFGLSTKDDFRFLRLNWEVCPQLSQSHWMNFSKGGNYSRYYFDLHLVLDWEDDGYRVKRFAEYKTKELFGSASWSRWINNWQDYFRPGINWPRRSQTGLSARILPRQTIFGDKSPSVFVANDGSEQLIVLLAFLNSKAFEALVQLQMAFGSYKLGVVQRTVLPNLDSDDARVAGEKAHNSFCIERNLDRANEISHVYHLPALLQVTGPTLAARADAWAHHVAQAHAQLDANQREIDRIALELYGLTEDDISIPGETDHRGQMSDVRSANDNLDTLDTADILAASDINDADDADETNNASDTCDPELHAAALISYLVGCAFGRWDVRFATGERLPPVLPDPFAPLPACSPGMLTGDDGLPLPAPPLGYPLAVDADGILSDDPDHADDIVRRVRDALDVIFGDASERWERDLCAALDVAKLREYFRKGAFWQAHIKRYSKSRRKAPIYWLLQSPKKHYALWLYLHRLTPDTLFKALVKYAEPKLRGEQARLEALQAKRAAASTPKDQRAFDRDIERQTAVVADVREFCERLERAAQLGLTPDLNDGVVLTIAPLRELVPWKEAARYWDELRAGKYAWSSIGQQLREKGLLK